MRRTRHRARVPDDVRRRASLDRDERVLAHGRAADGTWLLGTPAVLVVVPPGEEAHRLPWSGIQEVQWSGDEGRLGLVEVGSYGQERPRHAFTVDDADLLLQLVRERVQSSIVIQRKVLVERRRGFSVIGRRAPSGAIDWMVDYDPGVDPADPRVSALAQAALAQARSDVGE